jgi:DNA-binding Lrp family transcriptional regulator
MGLSTMASTRLDSIDRMILAELQADGRMTNVELAKRVGISAPPCLRRVRTLEENGYIKGYHAEVNAKELGFEVQVFVNVGLASQAESDLSAFEAKCKSWPLVRECHMLNGEVDFILKCVAPDLSSFQTFLTGELLTTPNVASVKTSLVIRGEKDEPGVPFNVLEARLLKDA